MVKSSPRKESKSKLTEMQQFTLDFINSQKDEVNPGYVDTMWAEHKKRHVPAASRDAFGLTSAAYRSLRKLHEMGLINKSESRTSGGYLIIKFSKLK